MKPAATLYERIYAVVKRVPRGRVASYGRIARMVGCRARQVGYALAAAKDDIPWQRIINSKGEISTRAGAARQRQRLTAEGIMFDAKGRVDFSKFGWGSENDEFMNTDI